MKITFSNHDRNVCRICTLREPTTNRRASFRGKDSYRPNLVACLVNGLKNTRENCTTAHVCVGVWWALEVKPKIHNKTLDFYFRPYYNFFFVSAEKNLLAVYFSVEHLQRKTCFHK